MRAAFHDEHALPELGGYALGNGQAEESRADDEEIETSGHRLLRVSDRVGLTHLARPGVRLRPNDGTRGPLSGGDHSRGRNYLTIQYHHSSHRNLTRTIDSVWFWPAWTAGRTETTQLKIELSRLRRLPCRTDADASFRQP
ncbi:hypothetical protein GCM10023161_43580 [Mycobacterium paraffinicum]|uniref:Uncharacterized protein n=1 Tax=Mycobacterium paraffinicum TaxID=53378 RepID=A0ABP8F477_9MYCO